MTLYTIGEFAQRCRLPVSTLRYYHELGILEPAEVDSATNYRYYAQSQLAVAVRIAEFRSVGLTPEQIHLLLTGSERDKTVATVRAEIVAEVDLQQRRLGRFDQLMAFEPSNPTIEAPALAETTFGWAVSQSVAATSGDLTRTVRRGFAALRRSSNVLGSFAATFPLDLGNDSFPVELHIESEVHAASHSTPVPVIKTLHTGPHRDLWVAYSAVIEHAQQHGHQPSGLVTERYLPIHDEQQQTQVLLHLKGVENTPRVRPIERCHRTSTEDS